MNIDPAFEYFTDIEKYQPITEPIEGDWTSYLSLHAGSWLGYEICRDEIDTAGHHQIGETGHSVLAGVAYEIPVGFQWRARDVYTAMMVNVKPVETYFWTAEGWRPRIPSLEKLEWGFIAAPPPWSGERERTLFEPEKGIIWGGGAFRGQENFWNLTLTQYPPNMLGASTIEEGPFKILLELQVDLRLIDVAAQEDSAFPQRRITIGDETKYVGDYKIDMRDIAAIAQRFGHDKARPGWDAWDERMFDFNMDGKINMKEIALLATRFGWTF